MGVGSCLLVLTNFDYPYSENIEGYPDFRHIYKSKYKSCKGFDGKIKVGVNDLIDSMLKTNPDNRKGLDEILNLNLWEHI